MKFFYCLYKEYLLLVRDKAAIGIIFIMPTLLVFIVTYIQDSTFRSVNESNIPLLLVDKDKDSLSAKLERALTQSNLFSAIKKDISSEETKELVASGKFLVGIIIPEKTSERLREKAEKRISRIFSPDSNETDTTALHLQLYFDPVTKQTFKTIISTSIDRIVSAIELQSMADVLNDQLNADPSDSMSESFELKPLLTTTQAYATDDHSGIIPNSVQHNVPAWTMFAMFFICIPLSSNIIREREDGSAFRLLTMPGSYLNVMAGKLGLYLIVNLIQLILMICMGLFVLPLIDLPRLQLGDPFSLFIIALSAGFAANGFGLLIGTIASTQDQASLFGAIFVIIMAAIGGVWVPTFVMPVIMKKIGTISPLNWGLEAFYGVFVRGLSVKDVWPQVVKLLVFFLACMGGAWYYQLYRRMR